MKPSTNLKRVAIVPVMTLGVIGITGFYHINTVDAAELDNYPPFVQRLAERFNLRKNEVQTFFDEERALHQEEVQARFDDRLKTAVEDGTITAEQQVLIKEKRAELQAEHETIKDLTPEERRTQMRTHYDEMKTWAEENDIDLSLLGGMKGAFEKGDFPHGGMGRGGLHDGFGSMTERWLFQQ